MLHLTALNLNPCSQLYLYRRVHKPCIIPSLHSVLLFLQVADDGHPIEVVRYNWEISSLELLCMIRDVVKKDHKGTAAKSFTFMVPFAYGTFHTHLNRDG